MPLNQSQQILINGILRTCDAQLRLLDAYEARLEDLKISCLQSTQGAVEALHFIFYVQGVPLQIRLMMNIEARHVQQMSPRMIHTILGSVNGYLSDSRKHYTKFKDQALRCSTVPTDGIQKEIDYLHEMVRTDTALMLDDHENTKHKANDTVKLFLAKDAKKYANDMVLEDYIYDFDLLRIMLDQLAKHIGSVQKRFLEIQNDPEIERQTAKTTAESRKKLEGFDPALNKMLQASVNTITAIGDTAMACDDRLVRFSAGLKDTDSRLDEISIIQAELFQKVKKAQDIYETNIRTFVAEVNAKMEAYGSIDLSGREALDYKRKVTAFYISVQTILLQVQQMEAEIARLEQQPLVPEAVTESWSSYFGSKAKAYLPAFITAKVFTPTLDNIAAEVVAPTEPVSEQLVTLPVEVAVEKAVLEVAVPATLSEHEAVTVDHDTLIAAAMEEARRVKDIEKDRKRKEYTERMAKAAEVDSDDSDLNTDEQDYNALFEQAPPKATALAKKVAELGSSNRELLIKIITAPQNELDNEYKYSQLKKLTIALGGEILKGKGSHRKFRFSEYDININKPEDEQTLSKTAVAGVPLPKNKGRLDSGYLNGVYVQQFRDALIELGIKQLLGIQEDMRRLKTSSARPRLV